MNKAHNGVPKAVTRTDELHSSGIFSLVNSPKTAARGFGVIKKVVSKRLTKPERPLDHST